MPVPQEILKLIERFDSQREAYQSGKYNEAQIRAEFIDPLFKALGWDICLPVKRVACAARTGTRISTRKISK